MNDNDIQVKAIETALYYLRHQNVRDDLRLQGLDNNESESVLNAYCEIVDDLKAAKKLWEHNDD